MGGHETLIEGIHPGDFVQLQDMTVEFRDSGNNLRKFTFTKEHIQAYLNHLNGGEGLDTLQTGTSATPSYVMGTLDYNGNMQDGFTLRLSNLDGCQSITVTYTTVMDDTALCAAINKALADKGESPAAYYNLYLQNSANKNWIQDKTFPEKATHSSKVVATLAVDKTVEGEPEWTTKTLQA